jgi:hypothetical protein
MDRLARDNPKALSSGKVVASQQAFIASGPAVSDLNSISKHGLPR